LITQSYQEVIASFKQSQETSYFSILSTFLTKFGCESLIEEIDSISNSDFSLIVKFWVKVVDTDEFKDLIVSKDLPVNI
jgi:hypothetical protein